MLTYPRLYENILARHLAEDRQMAFVSGPRQVGKTTVCRALADLALNYDVPKDRLAILAGEDAFLSRLPLKPRRGALPVLLLDEMHKHPKWKNYLKGLFDANEQRLRIIVTGSSRLDAFRRAGDALTGRYFSYRMHPFSVAELLRQDPPRGPLSPQQPLEESEYQALWRFGGFPEPFGKRDPQHLERWSQRRHESLLREDARDLGRVVMLQSLESLTLLLAERSAGQLNMAKLAAVLAVSPHTVKAWVGLLESLHWGFSLTPYHQRLARALRKEPKWYLRDWSGIEDPGARFETFVACHLLKAVEGWTDLGLGRFSLHYLRDKEGQEVDFLICRQGRPWILVEAKLSDRSLAPSLSAYQKALGAEFAIQAVGDLPYQDSTAFVPGRPVVAPARTFLSQLL